MTPNQNAAITLGEKIIPRSNMPRMSLMRIILGAYSLGLLTWLASGIPIVGIATTALCSFVLLRFRRAKHSNQTMLLAGDQQGFMKKLRLADKTALFDGNNIFHFGLDNGIGATALWALANSLRSEGYRIVCFFDANIFFTLRENDELQNQQGRFSVNMLKEIFGLQPNEIYVVPSGQQADVYIIETLSLLPVSFAVTNDRFRDYEDTHAVLRKDNQWRKGVVVKGGELRLFQHKFERRLRV